MQPTAGTRRREFTHAGQAGITQHDDRGGTGQTRRRQDPGTQCQRARRASRRSVVYTNTRLTCQGQIRFGDDGKAAAAALWLVAPCTELFSDGRSDDSVDLAVGTDFTTLTHSDDIDAVLAGLRPDATEPADPALIAKIHSASC